MDDRLIELYVQRGRLRERIQTQRAQVAQALTPVRTTLNRTDQVRALARQGKTWAFAHPALVVAATVTLLVWRPRAILGSLRWGYTLWQQWQRVRAWTHIA